MNHHYHYQQLKLIAETNYLHSLWHLGPPHHPQPPQHHPQPPQHHPQPPYYHPQPPQHHPQPPQPPQHQPPPPSTSVYLLHHPATPASFKHWSPVPYTGDPTASFSRVTPKLVPEALMLPPPETIREGDVDGSVDVIVLCQGEVCEKGKENAGEGTNDTSGNGGTLLVKKGPSGEIYAELNKEMVNEGDVNGSRDVTVPCQGEVCEEKGEAEDIVNKGHMEGSVHVTNVSEEKGEVVENVNEVNMEGLAAAVVISEGEVCQEQGKAEAKAALECEDGLAGANNLVGGEELCSDVQLLQAEETVCEGDINGSRDVTVPCQSEVCEEKGEPEDIVNEGHMEGSMHATEVSVEKGEAEVKSVLESEDGLADANNLVGGKELCLSDVQLLQAEETVNEGDMKGSRDVWVTYGRRRARHETVLCQGDVCKEKGKAEKIVHDGDKEGSINVTVSCQHDTWKEIVDEGVKEGSVDVTVSCQGGRWEAEEIVNEGDQEGSMDVTVSCQGDALGAEEIVNEGEKEGSMEVTVSCQGDALGAEESINEGEMDASMDAIVSCQGKENAGEGTNDSSCNGGMWLVKKCSSGGIYAGLNKVTVKEGDMNGSRDVTVPCQGEVCEEKGKSEEVVNEVKMEDSIAVTVEFEGEVSKEQGKGEEIVNVVKIENSVAVIGIYEGELCKEQGKAEEIVNEVKMEGSTTVAVKFEGEKTDSDGDKKGSIDATVSCPGERCKEKGKAKEGVGARIEDSTCNGGRWQHTEYSGVAIYENSGGSTPSEAQFMLYKLADESPIQQMPKINLDDTQAIEQSSSLEKYVEGTEGIKNSVWGNTFFLSRRTAKLLGPILAGGFQYRPSLPDKLASSSQPMAASQKPRPRTRKQKARAS